MFFFVFYHISRTTYKYDQAKDIYCTANHLASCHRPCGYVIFISKSFLEKSGEKGGFVKHKYLMICIKNIILIKLL